MIIALMGNDGSGKTTIAKELVKIFRQIYFFKKVKYLREFYYFIFSKLFRFLGNRISSVRKDLWSKKRRKKLYFWPYLVLLDQLLAYIYYKVFKRHEVIIADRYVYDFFNKLGVFRIFK